MSSRIKVLHFCNLEKDNYYLNNLCDYSDESLVEYLLVTLAPECEFAKSLEKRGKKTFCLNCMKRERYPKAFYKLSKIIDKEKPDIIHTHLFDPTLIGITIAKTKGIKVVVTRHHSNSLYHIPSAIKRKFYLTLESYINRNADHIIAPSKTVYEILTEKEKVPKNKVSIIPYGQTSERFDRITKEQIARIRQELKMNEELSLVYVARLYHRKGHIYLFEAFANLLKKGIKANLYLVGEGAYRKELEQKVKEMNIENSVKFLGWRDDALAIIAASDIVVHPSLEDALSSAVIESLMLGKPIVATDISGVRDILKEGKYGKIVPPEDSKALEKAIEEIIQNLEKARDTARNARNYLLDYMSAEKVAKEYLNVYRKVLER